MIPARASAISAVIRAMPLRSVALAPDSPQVFVDYTHLVTLPAERAGSIDQCIMSFGGFAVVLDLGGGGLAYIVEGGAVQMSGLDPAVVSYRCSPRSCHQDVSSVRSGELALRWRPRVVRR